jgi:hypothetical protein
MRTADTILNIIQDRGKRQLPLDDVYRQLYNPDFYLRSYAKMYKNNGAMCGLSHIVGSCPFLVI